MTLITGVAKLPSGAVYPAAEFIFWQANRLVLSQDSAVVPPVRTVVTADDVGAVSFDLLPGNYTGRHQLTGVNFSFVVPDASTATFSSCVSAAVAPDIVEYPATQISMIGGGSAQDYAGFATRAAFVAWAAGKTPAVGTIIDAAGYSYRYIGSGTTIADLPGWGPNGEAFEEHWGATGDGVTNDGPSLTPWAAFQADKLYRTNGTINHPNVREVVEVAIRGAGSPVYKIMQSHVRLTGRMKGTNGTGFTLLVEPGAAGVVGVAIDGMDIESDGFSVLFKDISVLNGLMEAVRVAGNNIRGDAATTDVGVSFDGNTVGATVYGNLFTNILRNDAAPRFAHAMAVAGLAGGGGPTADSKGLMFIGNVALRINGNVLHVEDLSPGVGAIGNVGIDIDRGIEIVNDAVPSNQVYIGQFFQKWARNAIYNAGTGSSRAMIFAFNMMDGTDSVADVAHVRINQTATGGIGYIGNLHINMTGDAVETTAENGLNLAHNVFEDVTGAAIVGKATAAKRGVLVDNWQTFRNVGAILDKAKSANLIGGVFSHPVLMISNLNTEEVLLHAEVPGYLMKVTVTHDDTPLSGQVNATFAIVKRTPAGAETILFDNSIRHAALANEIDEWGPENVQITTHTWDAGDVILARCIAGGSPNTRSASVQIEYFHYWS